MKTRFFWWHSTSKAFRMFPFRVLLSNHNSVWCFLPEDNSAGLRLSKSSLRNWDSEIGALFPAFCHHCTMEQCLIFSIKKQNGNHQSPFQALKKIDQYSIKALHFYHYVKYSVPPPQNQPDFDNYLLYSPGIFQLPFMPIQAQQHLSRAKTSLTPVSI